MPARINGANHAMGKAISKQRFATQSAVFIQQRAFVQAARHCLQCGQAYSQGQAKRFAVFRRVVRVVTPQRFLPDRLVVPIYPARGWHAGPRRTFAADLRPLTGAVRGIFSPERLSRQSRHRPNGVIAGASVLRLRAPQVPNAPDQGDRVEMQADHVRRRI